MGIFNKNFFIIIAGNILDYYDFLLFAHLGSFIINKFIPLQSETNTHLLSLMLFGISFFARPIGGYFFGYLSDRYGRIFALSKAIAISAFATICFTFLPDYSQIGKLSIYLFILLRLLQGASIGGEYTTAGIYLMERHSGHKGLISGILCASGTIGSLFGLLARRCAPSASE
jgi:MFS family permease